MSDIMSKVKRVPPNELFHYSDFTGLNGVITNKEIWMGDILFLNDEKEYQLGLDLFKNELDIQKKQYANTSFGIFLNSLNSIEELLKQSPPLSFSLTEESDLLSQWRGYTKNGIGVSIGFRSSNLINGFQLLPCLYLLEDQNAYVKHLFKLAFHKFSNTKESDAINEAGNQIIGHLNVACAIIKEHSFKEEKEWRLVHFDRNNLEFISKDTYLKPIKKIAIKPNEVISSITVGPNPNKALCESSIHALLKANQLTNVNVSLSEIPYRN